MTKKSPNQVIELRISLQDKQIEQLDSFITSYQINRILTPIVTLMNDVTGMIVLLTLAASLGFAGIAFAYQATSPTEDMHVILTDFFLQRDQAAMAAGVTIAARGPIWGFVDILERVFNVNIPDFGGGYEPPSSGSSEPGRAPGTATGGVE